MKLGLMVSLSKSDKKHSKMYGVLTLPGETSVLARWEIVSNGYFSNSEKIALTLAYWIRINQRRFAAKAETKYNIPPCIRACKRCDGVHDREALYV